MSESKMTPHVTLRAAAAEKVPAPRMTGDCDTWAESGTHPGHEGDRAWRDAVLLEPGVYRQATSLWTMSGTPPKGSPSKT